MAELLAALLLLAGSAVALIAAIGVFRLPDAFLRMHAATKAGVVGASLVLLGAALAFGGGEVWVRVALIVAFLLATVPVSSHALARAAYVGGAPMWGGTATDQLRGVLARHAPEEAPSGGARPAAAGAPRAAGRRALLVLTGGPEEAPALVAALRALRGEVAEATLLSLLPRGPRERSGPVPFGGAYWTPQLAEHRIAAAREAAGQLAATLQEECAALGIPWRIRHEEGDADRLLAQAAARHDLVILGRALWLAQAEATGTEPAFAAPGMLLALPGMAPPGRVLFLHEGDGASAEALARFLDLGLAAGARLVLAAPALPGAEAALAEAVALAAARGRAAEALPTPIGAEPPSSAAFDLVVLPARAGRARAVHLALLRGPAPVLLA
ncbi:monovalent cation/H(+) antiporter subunit G [Crenalkalicoccus roseus]|uniref:monovalent cation/H(+) antiporter subunit G n=1 Tax=Crenalkalicoccus roseus TaxID=1485588 RepID=UPI00195ABEF4|nr:monovalent cation/H(+) antiporter subunit G [Crenalkalicoccus roseus]